MAIFHPIWAAASVVHPSKGEGSERGHLRVRAVRVAVAQQPPENRPAPAPPAGRPQGCPGGGGGGGEGRARTAAERASEAACGG